MRGDFIFSLTTGMGNLEWETLFPIHKRDYSRGPVGQCQFQKKGVRRKDTILKEIAKAYLVPHINSNFEKRVRLLKGMIGRYRANGFLMHSDRNC